MTPEHIDDALPRVPAGISALAGDLTDTEERAAAVEWLWNLYRDALRGPESDEQGSGGTSRPTDNNRGLERNEGCTVQGTLVAVGEERDSWFICSIEEECESVATYTVGNSKAPDWDGYAVCDEHKHLVDEPTA